MRLHLVIFLVVAGLMGACVTPSIPIPPPDPSEMTFHLSGVGVDTAVVFTYAANGAYVGCYATVFDRNTGRSVGQLTESDGSVSPTLPLPATLGDNIVVSIECDKQTVATCIVLREGAQDPTVYCQ